MKNKRPTCLVIGDINIDFSIYASAYPPEGGEANAESSVFQLGGSGCSTALMLQMLGVQTSLAANIGEDIFADFAMSHIQKTGLDTQLIQLIPDQQTGFFTILITPIAQRTMFGQRGANTVPFSTVELLTKVYEVDHLHISGYSLIGNDQYEVVFQAVKQARAIQKTISLDPGVCSSGQVKEKIFSLLPFVDFFIPSRDEVNMLVNGIHEGKDQINFLLKKGCGALVLKQAEKGSSFVSSELQIHEPAISIQGQTIHNSTGAGDSFDAGFLHEILLGGTPEQALRFGNAAAYLMITAPHGILDLIDEIDIGEKMLELSKTSGI